MKMNSEIKNSLRALTILFFFASCQKGGSDTITPKSAANPVAETAAVIPDKVCSDKLTQANSQLTESKGKNQQISNSLADKKEDPKLTEEMRRSAMEQVASCKLIANLFRQENMTACLKSETPKTAENSLYRDAIENSCKKVLSWYSKSKPTPAEQALIPAEKKTPHFTFHFDESARELIQSKNSETFTYLAQAEIKKGQEQFQTDSLNGAVTCSFSAPSEAVTQELNLKVISEMPENSIDMNFPYKGKFISLALEDSSRSVISMTCLNMSPEITTEKMADLQKVFGKLISIDNSEQKTLDRPVETPTAITALANSELTKNQPATELTPPAEINKPDAAKKNDESKTAAANKIKTDVAIDSAITKTKETISDVVKEAVSQVKTAADETRSTTIKEVTQATREVSKEFIADAKKAAKEVVSESIESAQSTVIKTVKAPFIYLNNKALEVKKEIKDKVAHAAAYVKEKSIRIKDAVTTTISETAAVVKQKALAAKDALANALKSPTEYWTDFLAKTK